MVDAITRRFNTQRKRRLPSFSLPLERDDREGKQAIKIPFQQSASLKKDLCGSGR
jgi:hypothetical protein